MNKKFLLFFFTAFCLYLNLYAGNVGRIYGKITFNNGLPVPYARVIIEKSKYGAQSGEDGNFILLDIPYGSYKLIVQVMGYKTYTTDLIIDTDQYIILDIELEKSNIKFTDGPIINTNSLSFSSSHNSYIVQDKKRYFDLENNTYYYPPMYRKDIESKINPFPFYYTYLNPFSIFPFGYDYSSYYDLKLRINNKILPSPRLTKIEDLINHFDYNYQYGDSDKGILIKTETGICPWNPDHDIVRIGIKAGRANYPTNYVFIVTVFDLPTPQNILPLVKQSLRKFAGFLKPKDTFSFVFSNNEISFHTYKTSNDLQIFFDEIDKIDCIKMRDYANARELALNHLSEMSGKFKEDKLIIFTDQFFGYNNSSSLSNFRFYNAQKEEKYLNIYSSVISIGSTDDYYFYSYRNKYKGKINYYFVNSCEETDSALKIIYNNTSTIIAKDVITQVEFNPAKVKAYRLIGYENRLPINQEAVSYNDIRSTLYSDQAHTVLYEIVRTNSKESDINKNAPITDKNKLSKTALKSDELLTVNLKVNFPKSGNYNDKHYIVKDSTQKTNSSDFNFSCAVAGFGMLLKKDQFKENIYWDMIYNLAKNSIGEDKNGKRKEFLSFIEKARIIDSKNNNDSNQKPKSP